MMIQSISIPTSHDSTPRSRWSACANGCIFLAISVLSLWISSYRVASLVANTYLPTPAYESVKQTCKSSYELVVDQNNKFSMCSKNAFIGCFSRFEDSKLALDKELQFIRNQTALAITQMDAIGLVCNSNLTSLASALENWGLLKNFSPSAYSTSTPGQLYDGSSVANCTSEEKSLVLNASADAISGRESYNFFATSEANALETLDYVTALNRYNANYLRNATALIPALLHLSLYNESLRWKQTLDVVVLDIYQSSMGMLNCFSFLNRSIDAIDMCLGGISFKNEYNDFLAAVDFASLKLNFQYSALQSNIDAYEEKVYGAVRNMNGFYDSISGARGLIKWLKDQRIIDINYNLCGKGSPDWCSFSLTDFAVSPTSFTILSLDNVAVPDFQAEFDDSMKAYKDSLHNKMTLLNASIESFATDLEDSFSSMMLSGFFPEYEPPLFPGAGGNIEMAKASVVERGRDFRNSSLLKMKQFDAAAESLKGISLEFPSVASKISISKIDLLWFPLDISDINLEPFLDILTDFNSILLTLDLAYRIISTLTMLYKGYRSKFIIVDPFDLRVDDQKDTLSDKNKAICQMIQIFLTKVWIQAVVLLIFIVCVAYLLVSLFNFEFASYQNGCLSEDLSSHSFFSSKIYSISYNFASFEGNRHASSEISRYNYVSTTQASDLLTSWKIVFDNLHTELASSNASTNLCLDRFDAYLSCFSDCSAIIHEQLRQFNSSSSNSSSDIARCYSYLSDVASTSDNLAARSRDILANASYPSLSYDAFPHCSCNCHGPDENILFFASKSCSCMAEWMFNASIVRGVVAMLFFVAINISRVLLVKGVAFILWSKLESDSDMYEVRLSCDKDGNLHKLENGDIAKDIENLEKSFHTRGYLFIAAAVVVSCSWVYIFPAINYSTTYDPNSV